jgi:hypothetical protein
MLDGQHRCLACVQSDISFETLVVYGVDPATFDTMDTGKSRRAGDILSISGCRNANAVAGALRWLTALRSGGPLKARQGYFPGDEALEMWAEDRAIEDSVAYVTKIKKVMSTSLAGALHRMFRDLDAEAADRFFDDLASGAGLAADDPVFVLRDQLLRDRGAKTRLRPEEVAARCIRAWNHRRSDRRTRTLRGLVSMPHGQRPVLPDIL